MKRVWILLLASCAPAASPGLGPAAAGRLDWCLGAPDESALVASVEGENDVHSLDGTVVGFQQGEASGSFSPCPGGGAFLQIESADGVSWTLGWRATSGGEDRTPAQLDVLVGDTVHLEVHREKGTFSGDAAVLLTSGERLLLAAEQGYDTQLGAGPLGFSVDLGDDTTRVETDSCGTRVPLYLSITDDRGARSADTWVEETVVRYGQELEFRNVGAFRYLGQVECTDTWGPAPWIAWASASAGATTDAPAE